MLPALRAELLGRIVFTRALQSASMRRTEVEEKKGAFISCRKEEGEQRCSCSHWLDVLKGSFLEGKARCKRQDWESRFLS